MVILALLVGILVRTAPARMPQALAGGADILSVLLGDAKKDISGAMVQEADSYFHGGIDIDCHHLHGQGHHHDDPCHMGHDHDGHHHHDDNPHPDGDDHHHQEERPAADHGMEEEEHVEETFDPWRWINSHIRAPEIDRHLANDKAVEMMPWFWVAIKADPHNVKAWGMAWYVASHMMKDSALALRIAHEGQRLNPESLEMTCLLGRVYRTDGTRDNEKSEAMFQQVVEMAEKAEKLEDDDQFAFFSSVGYLLETEKTRKDAKSLSALLETARRVNSQHPTVRLIEQALRSAREARDL